MTRPIDAEEHAWALDCLAHGDTLADLAEGSGRRESEWVAVLGKLARIPARVSERLALVDLGLNYQEAGDQLGVTRHAIYRSVMRARRMGLPIPGREPGPATTQLVREQILALARDQVPYKEIAAQLNIDPSTVRKFAGPSPRAWAGRTENFRRRA